MTKLLQIGLGLTMLVGATAFAQERAPIDDMPVRYAVEVLVFEHRDQSRSTSEIPLPADPFGRETNGGPAAPAGPRLEFLVMDPDAQRPSIGPLDAADRSLSGAWRRLERLDAYQPIAYLSWSQTALGRAAADAFWLEEVGSAAPGLSGQVKLYKERFLHLALDLSWRQPAPTQAPGSDRDAELPPARIEESRRLKGDVVQYFDNPRFGAIAYVRVLEVPGAEEAETLPAG